MNNEMTKLENVRKSCKTASTIAKVISVIMIVGLVLVACGTAILTIYAEQINTELGSRPEYAENISVDIQFLNQSFTPIAQNMIADGEYVSAYVLCCAVAIFALVLALIIILLIKKIFDSILEMNSPFEPVVLKRMKTSFIVVVILTAVGSGAGFAVMLAMIFWCIYTIFQYGAELQKQSDETL